MVPEARRPPEPAVAPRRGGCCPALAWALGEVGGKWWAFGEDPGSVVSCDALDRVPGPGTVTPLFLRWLLLSPVCLLLPFPSTSCHHWLPLSTPHLLRLCSSSSLSSHQPILHSHVHLSTHTTHSSFYLSIHPSIYPSAYSVTHPPLICLSIYVPIHPPSSCPSIYPPSRPLLSLSIQPFTYPSIHLSSYPPTHTSFLSFPSCFPIPTSPPFPSYFQSTRIPTPPPSVSMSPHMRPLPSSSSVHSSVHLSCVLAPRGPCRELCRFSVVCILYQAA